MRMVVLEGTERKYSRELKKMLNKSTPVCMIENEICAGQWYDTVFVAPDFAQSDVKICSSYALLARDCDAGKLLEKIASTTIVTYGTAKSTLSISSVGEKSIVALQREISDSAGRQFSIGEICVDCGFVEPEDACALAGAMILGGLIG